MKIIENCWDEVMASECIFGAHIVQDSVAKIYVHDGLAVGLEMGELFSHMNANGFAGPCILVFYGVKRFDFSVREYECINDQTFWADSIYTHFEGQINGKTEIYYLGGNLYGFSACASFEIEAQKFELHILEKDKNK